VRTEGIALLQSLSRHLGSVDPTSRLRFELGLTLLAGHPAQRNFDVARIEMCLRAGDLDSDIARLAKLFVDVNHCEEDSTATASEIAERFGSAFVDHPMPIDDPVGEAVLMRVSRLLLHSDQFAVVDEFLEVARRRAFAAGDVALEVDALRLIVLSNLWQGSLDRAREALGRHDELCGATGRQPVIGSAELFIAQDRLDEALHRFALNDLERIVDPLENAKALVERGRLLNAAARADEAFETFERARAMVHRAGLNLEALVAWRPSMAEALASLGRWEQAVTLASEHLHAARSFGARRALGVAFRTMAAVTQESEARATWLTAAIETLDGSPLRLDLASALIDLGALLVERGERDSARARLDQGLELASACKAERLVRLAGAHLATLATHNGDAGDVGVAFVYS
jgi:tetratricopeptide (TPR) repeat protein